MEKADQNLKRATSAAHQPKIDVSHVQRKDPTPTLNRVCTELDLDIVSYSQSSQAQFPSIRPIRSRRNDYNDLANATETDLLSPGDVGIEAMSTPNENAVSAPELRSRKIFVAFMGGILLVAFVGITIACICACCYDPHEKKERRAAGRPVKKQRRHGVNRERRAEREWRDEERRRRYWEGPRSRNRHEAMTDDLEMAYFYQVWLPRIDSLGSRC